MRPRAGAGARAHAAAIRCCHPRNDRVSDPYDRARASFPLATRNEIEAAISWVRSVAFDGARARAAATVEADDMDEFTAAWNAAKRGKNIR